MLKGVLTIDSQVFMLSQRMEEAGIKHDQKVRVNLTNVRAMPRYDTKTAEVRFCYMDEIQVLEALTPGDDKPLPQDAALQGLQFPHYGKFAINNCVLWSNGHNALIVDEHTEVRVLA